MRLRITFAKTEAMRYTSHLDLYRALERTIRRADFPLAYSNGFKPHPKINIASALPLGYVGDSEIVDIWLDSEAPIQEINDALKKASPPGIQINQIEAIDPHAPTLQTILAASEYVITLLEPIPELDSLLEQVITAKSIQRQRGEKSYDLRPLILTIARLPDDKDGRQRLITHLSAGEGVTGRPDEVILAIGGVPEATFVRRTHLIFADAQPEEQSVN